MTFCGQQTDTQSRQATSREVNMRRLAAGNQQRTGAWIRCIGIDIRWLGAERAVFSPGRSQGPVAAGYGLVQLRNHFG